MARILVMDGRECLRELLRQHAEARAVIVSAVKHRGVIMDCLKLGARGVVGKPLKFKDEAFCDNFRAVITDALCDDGKPEV